MKPRRRRRAGEEDRDVGILAIFQNYLGRGKDEDVVRNEMRMADLAERSLRLFAEEVLPELHSR